MKGGTMTNKIKGYHSSAMFDRTVTIQATPENRGWVYVVVSSQKDPPNRFTLPVRAEDMPRPEFDELFS